MAERGVSVDHATLNRWVVKYAPQIARKTRSVKRPPSKSCRMDETYVKVRGQWMYLYRTVDKQGETVDFLLSERRDTAAATLQGIEVAHMIRKDQFGQTGVSGFQQFTKLAA